MKKFIIVLMALAIVSTMVFAGTQDTLKGIVTAEYANCAKVTIFIGVIPNVFTAVESLSFKGDILSITTKNVSDKSRTYSKGLERFQIDYVRLTTDIKKGVTNMIVGMSFKTIKGEDFATAGALEKVLTSEYKNVNGKVSLLGITKMPIGFTQAFVTDFSVSGSILKIAYDDGKKSVVLHGATHRLSQVATKTDHKKSVVNIFALFE